VPPDHQEGLMGALYLVRHGQASRYDDGLDALSDLGVEQSRAVASELRRRGVEPTRIVTGGLLRQRQTAEALTGPEPEVDARWDEYDHLGVLTGHRHDVDPRTVQEALDAALTTWVGATEGYRETWPGFRRRVREALDALDPAGTTVVVTSAGPISAIAAALLDATPRGWLALNRVMVNTGITTLAVGRRGVSLVSFNDHAHLLSFDGHAHVAGDGRRLLTYR
jgi:broad specificity phosphatase PhoE